MGAFLEWDPSHGIPLLRCCQGTNLVECVDRQYNTTFRHKAGIEMGDAQISERRHRHNLDMAQQVYRDFPKVGHYDTWKIDVLQKLVGQNTGKLLYPGWTCVSDYLETDESFVTVLLHTSDLHDKLLNRVQQLQEADDYNPKLSRDVKFSCNSWGVPLPFLPVMRRVEYRLFSQLMLNDLQKFDENRMSHLWIAHVNGQGIFPKLPVQLKKYHQHWERNRRIQDAMERAKSEIELMNSYLAKKVPMEFKDGSNTVEGAFAETDEEVEFVDGEPGIGLGRELQHDDITPPAQQGNVVGNVNRVHFNPQADSSNAPLPTGTKKIKKTDRTAYDSGKLRDGRSGNKSAKETRIPDTFGVQIRFREFIRGKRAKRERVTARQVLDYLVSANIISVETGGME
ncbi:hypothetical protein IV203_003393 [Nitzschia inconspicua]|uniref:Uncharacterized protein n=1 Tax=Nitzschia inconspicua TaxID=303405 RepID=A0A9K3L283_9STRA|nr:hypothetical protein IV203_003393 [Nitzschia inconspicua]